MKMSNMHVQVTDMPSHCSRKETKISFGITTILMVVCTFPIVIRYSDGLESTNTKRNNLLIAVLCSLFGIIFAVFVIWKCNTCEDPDEIICGLFQLESCRMSISVTMLAVLVTSVGVGGYIIHKSLVSIPDSCASRDECQSHCADVSQDLQAKLNDVQNVRLGVLNDNEHECGKCTCMCPSNHHVEKCNPVEHAHFGLSTATKIVIGVYTCFILILICIAVKMHLISIDLSVGCNCRSENNILARLYYLGCVLRRQILHNRNEHGCTSPSEWDVQSEAFPQTIATAPTLVHDEWGLATYQEQREINDVSIIAVKPCAMPSAPPKENGEERQRDLPTDGSMQGQCLACMDKQATMLLKPCKHLCMCKPCWYQYKRDKDVCPKCRMKIIMHAVEEIYLN